MRLLREIRLIKLFIFGIFPSISVGIRSSNNTIWSIFDLLPSFPPNSRTGKLLHAEEQDTVSNLYTLGHESNESKGWPALPKPTSVMVPLLRQYPLLTQNEKGIVIYASGHSPRYAHGALVLVEILRGNVNVRKRSGYTSAKALSDLPVEIFYGCEEEAFPLFLLRRLERLKNVSVRSLTGVLSDLHVDGRKAAVSTANENVCHSLPAYGRKTLAAVLSSFERLVLFDADVIPLVDPETLFALPAFEKSGMVIFGDYVPMGTYFNEHERLFDFLGLDTYKYHQIFRSQEADSSGMAFNKRFERSSLKGAKSNVVWAGLHLTLAMNAMNASYYRSPPPPEKAQSGFAFGDKDLWALGAILAGVQLEPPPTSPAALAVNLSRAVSLDGQTSTALAREYQRFELLHYWERFNPKIENEAFFPSIQPGRACSYQILEGHLQRGSFLIDGNMTLTKPLFLNAQSSLFGVLTYFQLADIHYEKQPDIIFARRFPGRPPGGISHQKMHFKLCDTHEAAMIHATLLSPEVINIIRMAAQLYSSIVDASEGTEESGNPIGETRVVTVEHNFRAKPSLGISIGEGHSGIVFVTAVSTSSNPQIFPGMVLLSVGDKSCLGRGLNNTVALLRSQHKIFDFDASSISSGKINGSATLVSFAAWMEDSRFRKHWY